MGSDKGFQRVNFFTGFQTTADDWNDVISYDVEKHRLHNRLYHSAGIVPNVAGGLKVSARGRADLSVEVSSGYGIDGHGNDIFLPEPEIKTLNPGDFKLPQTVYIVVKYIEELTDFVSYRANLEYKGHRRLSEHVKIEAIITEPDIEREVELARVQLTKGVKKITDAKDPLSPKANELDLRFVPVAGIVGSRLSPVMLREMADVMDRGREVFGHLFHNLRITPAADVLHALLTMEMMRVSNQLDTSNVFDLWALIYGLQNGVIADVEANHPDFSSKKEFASFKKHVELLESMHGEGKMTPEFLANIIGYQRKSNENIGTAFAAKQKRKKVQSTGKQATEAVWEKIKVRSDDFGPSLTIEGVKFKQADFVDLLEKKSEKDHKFRIVDAKDKYRTRQKLKYPDGVIVEDAGIAFEGGYAEWEVSNVTPNKDVIMVMRTDYVKGGWEADVHVNKKKTGVWKCEGSDRKFRWRNWVYQIPAEHVTDTFLTLRVTHMNADRDINMFKMWFYQPA